MFFSPSSTESDPDDAQDQSRLASSLQTASNLGILPDLVSRLVRDLSEAVEDRIRNAFDLSSISKEIVAKGMGLDADRPASSCSSAFPPVTQNPSSLRQVCCTSHACGSSLRA